jgi:hypothetical protein
MVAWLTSKAKATPTQGAKTDANEKPVDVNQFKDTFQPDDGVFSPNLPLPPMDVQVPRVFDFPSSYNTTFTPRAWEPISFQELRFLAENHRGLGDRQGHASGTCPVAVRLGEIAAAI